jgi:ATP-dependent RNA helicase RhlE
MSGEAVSLVCIDEHKLLFDIEKFIKSEIKKVHIEAFTPDPNIKAEPIQNGRGGGQKRGGGNSRNRNRSSSKPNAAGKQENNKNDIKKKKSQNTAASQIGARMQEKLDKLDKRDSSTDARSQNNNKKNNYRKR